MVEQQTDILEALGSNPNLTTLLRGRLMVDQEAHILSVGVRLPSSHLWNYNIYGICAGLKILKFRIVT